MININRNIIKIGEENIFLNINKNIIYIYK